MHNIHLALQGSCSFIVCLFKYSSFLKVNQHAQHSYGSTRFMLIYHVSLQIFLIFESKSTWITFIWLHHKVHAHLSCESSNIIWFWKLINMRNIHMAPLGSCSFIVCLFKYSSFFKVNQHAQHSYGSTKLMLIYRVSLQIFFIFESKSTWTTFICLH